MYAPDAMHISALSDSGPGDGEGHAYGSALHSPAADFCQGPGRRPFGRLARRIVPGPLGRTFLCG